VQRASIELSNGEDRMFWERLEEMPWSEVEQECVSRREQLCLQIAMLESRLNECDKLSAEGRELGTAKQAVQSQLTMVGERMKYARRLMTKIEWRAAVFEIYGQEGIDQCSEWIAAREQYEKANGDLQSLR